MIKVQLLPFVKRYVFLSAITMVFLISFNAEAQFWVLSGSKADSLSKNLIEDFSIDLDKVERYTHHINRDNTYYKQQDSVKSQYKTDSIDFQFSRLQPKYSKEETIWISLIESDNFQEIDLSFKDFELSENAVLYFFSKDFNEFAGPIRRKDIKSGRKRLLRTSFFESSGIYVLLVESGGADRMKSRLQVNGINYIEKDNSIVESKLRIASTSPSSACYPELDNQAFAVGRFQSSRMNCSFAVINNENNDRRPLILSARHCITGLWGLDPTPLTSSDIEAIENANFSIAWRYNCGGSGAGESRRWVGTGSTYLASQWPSDHLLAELEDVLPMSINYLGWDRTDALNGTPVYGLHHPGGGSYQSRQHYSLGSITNQGSDKYTVTWNLGETLGGSSGSPLLRTGDHKILGGLSWGLSNDKYFKLSNAWNSSPGALKPFLSDVQNLTSLNALIPTQLVGPAVLCTNQTETYTMPNLLSGESVSSWSVSTGLQIISSTGNSVTVKALGSTYKATITATFSVIVDADDSTIASRTSSLTIWLDKPEISVTNTTTDHTTGGFYLFMDPGGNVLRHSNTSPISLVSWTFPSTWSTNLTSGNNIIVYSWSGTDPFTVDVSNTCGTKSAFFNPISTGSLRMAGRSSIYPNTTREKVNVRINDLSDTDSVKEINIISSTGRVYYHQEVDTMSWKTIKEAEEYPIELTKLPEGSYILEVKYEKTRETHHLIIK
jgi:hypothetical protein